MDDPRMAQLAQARAPRETHREVLRRRAAALAVVPRAERPRDTFSALAFALGGETWALSAAVVLQVFALRELTPLPGAASPLFGVTQWRGDVLVLLDLRHELGIDSAGLTDLGRVIVVEGRDHAFGLIADSTREMIDIDMAAIRSIPGSARRFVRGMLDSGVAVLDDSALLDVYGTRRAVTPASGG